MIQPVFLKAYTGIDNEGFVDCNIPTNPPPVPLVNRTPYPLTPVTSASTTDLKGSLVDRPVMEQLTVENLQKLDSKVMVLGETRSLDTIAEESSMWSQESVVI